MSLYKINSIYKNEDLIDFIEKLEDRYLVVNKRDEFHQLVNFSKNTDLAFHNWFRYREGFARELIERILVLNETTKDSIVIDPFVGSGTTSVVASLLGYNTFSLDINPISSYITNTKLTKYSEADLKDIECVIVNFDDYLKVFSSYESLNDDHSLMRYFSRSALEDLLKIKGYIDEKIDNAKLKQFFTCALLCIVEDVSDRRRDGNGLKTVKSKVNEVIPFYINKCYSMLLDLKNISSFIPKKSICLHGSAMDLYSEYYKVYKQGEFKNKVIIFSPPYPNSFDYFESYKLELVIGGFASDIKDIKKYRKNAVRSFIGRENVSECDKYIYELSTEILNKIPEKEALTGKKDSRTRKVPAMIRGYFEDMERVLHQCYDLLEEGNRTYIVVDQSAYLGVVIPTDIILAYQAEKYGFKVNEIIDCRGARTSTQQLKKYPYLKTMLRESIIVLEK